MYLEYFAKIPWSPSRIILTNFHLLCEVHWYLQLKFNNWFSELCKVFRFCVKMFPFASRTLEKSFWTWKLLSFRGMLQVYIHRDIFSRISSQNKVSWVWRGTWANKLHGWLWRIEIRKGYGRFYVLSLKIKSNLHVTFV